METQVTLTSEQARLCQAVLCQDLIRVSGLLLNQKGSAGFELTSQAAGELLDLSNRLQAALAAFGVSAAELESIVNRLGTSS